MDFFQIIRSVIDEGFLPHIFPCLGSLDGYCPDSLRVFLCSRITLWKAMN